MAVPKGNLVTPVAFDPDGNPVALEVDAAGNLKVTGGDGVSTFLALTDTPASFADQAKKSLVVNAAEDAVEFVNPVMITTAKARAYLDGNQNNIPTSTHTKVLLNTASYDPSSMFANSKFTIQVAGYYLVTAALVYESLSVIANKRYLVMIWKNGAVTSSANNQAAYVDSVGATVLDVLSCAVDDYIELYTWHNAGVNTPDVQGVDGLTFMSVHLLSLA